MKAALIMTAPLLCLLSACSDEADAPVRTDEQPVDAEMPPQPEISQPLANDLLTEEEADAALKDLEAQQRALEDSGEVDGTATDSNGE